MKPLFLRSELKEQIIKLGLSHVGEPGGGSFAGNFESNEKYFWFPFLDPEVIKILSLSEILVSLRHSHLGSFFLDPENNRKLSIGVIWNSGKGTGLL